MKYNLEGIGWGLEFSTWFLRLVSSGVTCFSLYSCTWLLSCIVSLAQEHFWVGVARHFVRHVQHLSGFASHKSKLSDLFSWHRRLIYEVWRFNFQPACNSLLRQDSPRPCSFCLETVQMMGFPLQLFWGNFVPQEIPLSSWLSSRRSSLQLYDHFHPFKRERIAVSVLWEEHWGQQG